MSTMTMLDEYVDALLGGGALVGADALVDDGTLISGSMLDAPTFDDRRLVAVQAVPAPHGCVAAAAPVDFASVPATSVEDTLAADTGAMPPFAANPMSEPAVRHQPEPAAPAPHPAPPAFVPVFVPAPAHAATLPVHSAAARPHPSDSPSAPRTSSTNQAMAISHRWLRVNVGNDSYALELLRVQEVVRLASIVALRGAARAVLGVMNLRGRIVPVVDLGLWLDAGRVHGDERSRIVVVERDDEMIGVLVSAVEDVVTLGRERIEPPLASSDRGAIVGIARVGAVPTVLLDANALFG